jgi:hypothetical protein
MHAYKKLQVVIMMLAGVNDMFIIATVSGQKRLLIYLNL